MKQLLLILACVIAPSVLIPTATGAPGDARERKEITLYPGEQKSLNAEGVDAISTGRPGIADIRITGDQKEILIVALAPGSTNLLVIMMDGRKIEYRITVAQILRRKNIRLDVYFVEVSQNSAHQLGIGWPTSVSAQAAGAVSLTKATGTPWVRNTSVTVSSTLLPRLDLGETQGWVRILDHARVVMANGEKGNYSSTSDRYFRVSSGIQASLATVTAGAVVGGRAAYDEVTGRLDLNLKAEFSQFTAPSGDDVPGRSAASLETTVNLELGQSLALAAVNNTNNAGGHSGLPILSQIPVLGVLFGTHSLQAATTQNVIFVVPTLVDSVAPEERDRVREALDVLGDTGGELDAPLVDTLGADRPDKPDPRKQKGSSR
jgi:pilus assembly protein CpaC